MATPIPETSSQPIRINEEGGAQSETLGRFDLIPGEALVRLAQVYGFGAQKYAVNNWHAIPGYEHINHALEHLAMFLLGRDDEDHLGHALCRLTMAVWAEHNRGDMKAPSAKGTIGGIKYDYGEDSGGKEVADPQRLRDMPNLR